jgi:hypothetical protein
VRYYLTRALLENGRFADAREHAQWCLQRRWGDPGSQRMLERALKGELAFQPEEHALRR